MLSAILGSPICSCQLAIGVRGENHGAALIPVVTDFKKVPALAVLERGHREVVEYQHIDARKLQQQSTDTAVHMRDSEFSKQFGDSFVQHGEAIPASFLGQCAS